jgi:hypothetical protein
MLWRSLAGGCLLLAGLGLAVAADEKGEDSALAAHRTRMAEFVRSFHISAGDPLVEAPLKEDPVLRYSDATRQQESEATLWVFGDKRPEAMLAVEFYPANGRGPAGKGAAWLYEIVSLSESRIHAERGAELNWTADKPGLAAKPVPDAPAAADRPAGRLTQIKQIHRRFVASEQAVIEGRVELRPLTTPLYRYADAEAGVIDGAIVSFANGTNPEVLLTLEAVKSGDGARWQYSLAQMTGGEVIVQLDGKEVWRCTEADPPAKRDSYVNGWVLDTNSTAN